MKFEDEYERGGSCRIGAVCQRRSRNEGYREEVITQCNFKGNNEKEFKYHHIGSRSALPEQLQALYGKYERPDVKTSGIVRDVASDTDTLAVKDTTTFANIPWRSVFTDPQLQSIIEKGLNNNVNLLNAALNVKIAEEQLKCAKLAFVPSLAFTPQGTIASWDGQAATKTYTMPVTASWMVRPLRQPAFEKRSAQMALLQLQDYQVSVKTNLIANIANMYYTLLMLDKQVELVNNMEGLTKDTWETMQKMHDLRLGYRTPAIQSAESNYYSVLTQKNRSVAPDS